jgi:diguanylate cyclase (GGDEF)-like protein
MLIDISSEGREELEFLGDLPGELPIIAAVPRSLKSLSSRLVKLGVTRVFYKPLQPQSVARELNRLLHLPSIGISLFDDSERRNPLKALRAEFLMATRSRLRDLICWTGKGCPAEEVAQWKREAHRLVGNLGVFGFASQVARAREIDVALSGDNALSEADRATIRLAAMEILNHLDERQECDILPLRRKVPSPELVVCSEDNYLASEIAVRLSRCGLFCVTRSHREFRDTVQEGCPDGIILDFSGIASEQVSEFGEILRTLKAPTIALDQALPLERRILLANSGVAAILEKPVDPGKVASKMQELLPAPTPTKLVVVDDDPLFLATLEALVSQNDTRITTLTSGRHLWDVLETRNPDLLILDIDIPDIDGISLCRAVRSDSRFCQLPIIFVSAVDTPECRKEIFSAGADDFIPKCIDRAELLGRIAARLARNRISRTLETDRLTGLMTRTPATTRIQNLLCQSKKRDLPTSLAILDLDHFKRINDRYGHPVGDQVLRSTAAHLADHFRSHDVLARWGGEEFVVVLFAMHCEQAAERLGKVLAHVKEEIHHSDRGEPFQVSFSAGVAEFPRDGRDLASLYKTADIALYQAKEDGRGRVGQVRETSRTVRKVDVVLVEDDHPLGTVIVDGLKAMGLSVAWYRDRVDATVAFRNGTVAGVLLLDQDLPDGSGFELLSELAGPCLDRTKIILLGGRLTEQQVVQSFRLGADDHLGKPFFLPVLFRRVETALGAEHARFEHTR